MKNWILFNWYLHQNRVILDFYDYEKFTFVNTAIQSESLKEFSELNMSFCFSVP